MTEAEAHAGDPRSRRNFDRITDHPEVGLFGVNLTPIPRKWTAKLPGSPYLGIHGYRFERFFPDYGLTRAVPGRVTPLVELDSIVPGIPAATFN